MDTEFLLLLLVIGIFSVLAGAMFLLVIRDTARRTGKWGINFEIPNCYRCGRKMPSSREPTSFRQAVFGGWNCPSCNCEMDKWGDAVSPEENLKRQQSEG